MFLSSCKGSKFFLNAEGLRKKIIAVNVFRNMVNQLRCSSQLNSVWWLTLSVCRYKVLQYYSITVLQKRLLQKS